MLEAKNHACTQNYLCVNSEMLHCLLYSLTSHMKREKISHRWQLWYFLGTVPSTNQRRALCYTASIFKPEDVMRRNCEKKLNNVVQHRFVAPYCCYFQVQCTQEVIGHKTTKHTLIIFSVWRSELGRHVKHDFLASAADTSVIMIMMSRHVHVRRILNSMIYSSQDFQVVR